MFGQGIADNSYKIQKGNNNEKKQYSSNYKCDSVDWT